MTSPIFTLLSLSVDLRDNVISGNLQAVDSEGTVSISRNRIGGSLQCRQNRLGADGYANDVRGNLDGQCAEL